jgi:hypothetical protein
MGLGPMSSLARGCSDSRSRTAFLAVGMVRLAACSQHGSAPPSSSGGVASGQVGNSGGTTSAGCGGLERPLRCHADDSGWKGCAPTPAARVHSDGSDRRTAHAQHYQPRSRSPLPWTPLWSDRHDLSGGNDQRGKQIHPRPPTRPQFIGSGRRLVILGGLMRSQHAIKAYPSGGQRDVFVVLASLALAGYNGRWSDVRHLTEICVSPNRRIWARNTTDVGNDW